MNIDKTTIIEDGSIIGKNVIIGPFCHIGKNVTIGDNVTIEANVTIKGKVNIDNNVKIFSFTNIGEESLAVYIGENTHIREFVRIGISEEENSNSDDIVIGSNNFIMAYVQIYNGVRLAENCTITNAVRLHSNVLCEERVIVGGLSVVESGCKIGTGVMIGGASVVSNDMPPFMLVEGNKATIKGLNVIGLRRRLENRSDIEDIKGVFKQILGKNADKLLAEEIAKNNPNELIKRLASFVATNNV